MTQRSPLLFAIHDPLLVSNWHVISLDFHDDADRLVVHHNSRAIALRAFSGLTAILTPLPMTEGHTPPDAVEGKALAYYWVQRTAEKRQ